MQEKASNWSTSNSKWRIPLAVAIPVAIALADLLFGNAWLLRFVTSDEVSSVADQKIFPENITIVSYNRGNGGYLTLGNIPQQVEPFGFKVLRWNSKGMIPSMEKGWGVSPRNYESGEGGIFYPPNLYEHALKIQEVLTRENPLLKKVVPLVKAKVGKKPIFISPKIIAQHSILVYPPD